MGMGKIVYFVPYMLLSVQFFSEVFQGHLLKGLYSNLVRRQILSRSLPMQDPNNYDDKLESRLYIGNLDLRITEAALIKMFSPFGKILSEDFLWHTRGPKRGEPRGYAFIQFSSKEEAIRAKEKMHGRMACGRPLVVRLASEKYMVEGISNSSKSFEGSRSSLSGGSCGQTSRSAKIAAIKNKLKAIDEESHKSSKKQKQTDISCTSTHENPPPER